MTSRKRPSAAFWATVVVIVIAVVLFIHQMHTATAVPHDASVGDAQSIADLIITDGTARAIGKICRITLDIAQVVYSLQLLYWLAWWISIVWTGP